MKRLVLGVLAAGVICIAAVVVVRTIQFGAAAHAADPAVASAPRVEAAPLDSAAAIERLAAAVRIPTISYFDSGPRTAEFLRLHAMLAASFPKVHATLRREVLDSGGLLFTWPGRDTTLRPVVLMGHMDVVPVEPGTEKAWTHGAFSGDVADGFVWGRGTLDDKSAVLSTLEAVEALVAQRFAPRRTVLLAFGYEEEKGGPSMPKLIALLRSRGVHPELVVDEGGIVTDGVVPGVARPVALIGIAEKGYLTLRLTARGAGGHSSMPPRETAVGVLAAAITKLERSPMPPRLDGATLAMFNTVGPQMPFGRRVVFANLWLFKPLLMRMFATTPTTDATIRTTTAPTMLQGSPKDNVLPSSATGVVNFRLLPGDRAAWVVRRVREVIDDPRVTVDTLPGLVVEASAVAPMDSWGYRELRGAVGDVYAAATVSPYLVMGATDSRYFSALTPNVYRFAPLRVTPADVERVHGTNERVGVGDYVRGIRFYRRLIERAAR